MFKTQPLAIDLLRTDGGTQNRLEINEDAVEDYSVLIAGSNGDWPFDPVDVFHDGNEYFVADGFHRTLGAQRAKRGSIPCQVHKGTAVDARIFGMTANDKHGMRMTRADKRACVNWLLDNGGKLTQKAIAEAAGVSARLVKMIIAERNPVSIAGKAKPPKQDSKGKLSPSTPKGSKTEPAYQPPDLSDEPEINGAQEKAKMKHPDGASVGSRCPNCLDAGRAVDWWEDDACGFCEHPIEVPSDSGRPPASPSPSPEPPAEPERAKGVDYGKCPNCAGSKWKEGEDGVLCAKCRHPHGEPAGDVDEERSKTQRQKTVKTAEALLRAFDDLHLLAPNNGQHKKAIDDTKQLLKTAKEWKL